MILKVNKTFKPFYLAILKPAIDGKPFLFSTTNFAGARISGKTFAMLLAGILIGLLHPTHIYAIRLVKEDLQKTLIQDAEKILSVLLKRPYNFSKKNLTIEFGNNSKISFIGLKKNRKEKLSMSGTSSNERYKYGLIIKDEIVEWKEEEEQSVDEAIRGFKYGYVNDTKAMNAFNLGHYHADIIYSEIEMAFPNFENILKTKQWIHLGKNTSWISPLTNEKKLSYEYTLLSAYRSNKFADENVIRKLMKLEKDDPIRARVSCYGLQGAVYHGIYKIEKFSHFDNTIFSYFLKSNFPNDEKITEYRIGFDYGWNDKTAAVLIGISKKIIYIIDCFVYDRKKQPIIDDRVLSTKLARKMEQWKKEYHFQDAYFAYDYSNKTFPLLLSDALKELSLSGVFIIRRCQKGNLEDRISILTYLFSKEQIKFNLSKKYSLQPLKQEFINSKRKDNNSEKPKKDGNDDIINAFEYALDNNLTRAMIPWEQLRLMLYK